MRKQRGFRSLRVQVLSLMIVVLMLPLGILGYVYYATMSSDLKDIESSHALEVSSSAHKLLDQLGEQLSSSVITNANWEAARAAMEVKDVAWLQENMDVSVGIIPHVDFMADLDMDGKVISQVGDVKEFTGKLADPKLLERVKKDADIYGMIETSKGLAFVAMSLVTDEARSKPPTGVLMFGRLLDEEALKGVGQLLNGELALRSVAGQFVTTDPAKVSENDVRSGTATASFVSRSIAGKRYSDVVSQHIGLSGSPVADITLVLPANASATVNKEMLRLSWIAGGMALALIVLISLIIRMRIVVPLVRFDRFLGEVANGQLQGELERRDRRRKDEIGSIAGSLQEMVQQLRAIVAGIRSTAAASAASADALSEEAERAALGANRISESMQEVAAGSESQKEGMNRGATATRGILDGILTVGEKTATISTAADHASREAEQGNVTVREAASQMERIADTVDSSVREAKQLALLSEDIGKMAEAISQIAARTNILALNANIEASRAGEQGRGFAVVADEVRKLALQADATASDISAKVEQIRGSIGKVAGRIGDGNQEVQSGLALVREAGVVFGRIASGVAEIDGELREMASASQEIGARSEELAALVEQTEAISESSANMAQNVADISESQMNAVRHVAGAIGDLAGRIRELEKAVNRFK